MRLLKFLISIAITIGLIFMLNHRWTIGGNRTPRLGSFLSPQTGFWQNAEDTSAGYSINLKTPLLEDKVNVYLDDRLVPHVFAQNEHDVYFVQGYLHAKFRLWQMEFQTYAAAGRLAELVGHKKGDYDIVEQRDRQFRRLGMGWAAENSVKAMEANPDTKAVMDAYTSGVNFYIDGLRPQDYPVEYKLLNYAPEPWSNLKTALFLKYMSYDLAGYEDDFEHNNILGSFTKKQFEQAYPYGNDSLIPIIPRDTPFAKPAIALHIPESADSLYFTYKQDSILPRDKPNPANGSNNWAVAGSKTASGRPILCGDPHLGLNLPSLWFEMQLHTPQWNAYGASFPGAAAIAIGFNDSIAWSETNAMRDVLDYYEITFRDRNQTEYLFNGQWMKTDWRVDTIKISGEPDMIDSIAMTVIGPVMYDHRYGNLSNNGKAYAARWKAHDPSNEGWTFVKLVRAKNYNDYLDAIKTFECPGQNFVFAAKNGDIAMWNQGAFPARWRRQGDFVMPGYDSSYMWQGIIPQAENPHEQNPVRGFVSSANQLPVDTTYPYYLAGGFDLYRGITISKMLRGMTGITPQRMKQMQTDDYNALAGTAVPFLKKHLYDSLLNDTGKKYADALRTWNYHNEASSIAPAVFVLLMNNLNKAVWNDELAAAGSLRVATPSQADLIEALLRDSAFLFVDDVRTVQRETINDIVQAAFTQTANQLDSIYQKNTGNITWGKINDGQVNHLLRIAPFSQLDLNVGGGSNVINATHGSHGPSWRMVVHLTDKTEAYGVYPGGQNGNPGSPFYNNFISTWAAGKYYPLWVMTDAEVASPRVKWKMSFSN